MSKIRNFLKIEEQEKEEVSVDSFEECTCKSLRS